MVTRITDTGILPGTTVKQGRTAASPAPTDTAAGTAEPKSAADPAVRISLSMNASPETSAPPSVSSEALVQEIRQRLASGQFQIDYEKVGEGMLRDLIAQSARKAQP
jgi:anti-sigma28 factor (negative regulator of flagellin synthesis)